jgi:uncharacterized protein with PIN domain
MRRYYETCPECHARMIRTGAKRVSVATGWNGETLYDYEYRCEFCSKNYVYDLNCNWLDSSDTAFVGIK